MTTSGVNSAGKTVYSCQATRLLEATRPLRWWSIGQYVRDVCSGNVSVRRALRVLSLSWLRTWADAGFAYRIARPVYDFAHRTLTGRAAPSVRGRVRDGTTTPTEVLGLRPGEWVRIKPASEIFGTLNQNNKNRGLWFDDEMQQHCGASFRVLSRVERIINEQTGEMIQMRNPCIVLDGAYCTASYTRLRLLCPRRIISYWREIWLERVPAPSTDIPSSGTT